MRGISVSKQAETYLELRVYLGPRAKERVLLEKREVEVGQFSEVGEVLVIKLGRTPRKAEKLGRPPTALELCLYFHTKDHDGVTFLDSRVEKIVTAIQRRWIELTQSQPYTPIDETELYLFVVECDDKGRTYGLGWTPSGPRRRHATVGGAGGRIGGGVGAGDGAGFSRPISSPNEPVELL
ncbi:hypothetical protein Scep_014779 [Stephania cephalantha]|uniref:Uncharacterized protein n=1 Tax=Stephania cephalantha TaxID=152367 RepID=A0AAP0P0Q9_9MAGN